MLDFTDRVASDTTTGPNKNKKETKYYNHCG